MSEPLTETTIRLIAALRAGDVPHRTGYLVGLDRPALLSPDPAALLAAQREEDILVTGHRWRVVTEALWLDLLSPGRERPLQQVYVVPVADLESWLGGSDGLSDLERDGWRGNQGRDFVLPLHTS